jgi:hypothetical protein
MEEWRGWCATFTLWAMIAHTTSPFIRTAHKSSLGLVKERDENLPGGHNPWDLLFSSSIELMINKLHGYIALWWLSVSLWRICITFFDQVKYFASIKLCQALSRQGAKIKISVVRCHYLLCSARQCAMRFILRRCWEITERMLRRRWEDAKKMLRRYWEDAEKMLRRCWEDAEKMLRRCWQDAEKILRRC